MDGLFIWLHTTTTATSAPHTKDMDAHSRPSTLVEKRDKDVCVSPEAPLPLLTVALSPRDPSTFKSESILFLDKDQYGPRAVVVRSVLSRDECLACMEYMQGSEMVPAHSRTDYRNNLRVLVRSKDFADEIFSRLHPVLAELHELDKSIDDSNADQCIDNGLGMTGTWHADRLNDCFRMCCYHPAGHFAPHYDADYVVDAVSHRSLKTMMIYLNDEYVGGETNFVAEHNLYWDEARKLYCAPPDSIVASFKARPGDVLLFDHKILHEGAQVVSGMKWMMRSEVMYRKDTAATTTAKDAAIAEALQLLQGAKNAEGSGDMTTAVKLYSKAFKLYPDLERFT